jgi:hypothetical protein
LKRAFNEIYTDLIITKFRSFAVAMGQVMPVLKDQILSYRTSGYGQFSLLVYNAVYSFERELTFRER